MKEVDTMLPETYKDLTNYMLYLRLSHKKAVRSVEVEDGLVIFNIDESNQLVSISILSVEMITNRY